MSENGSKEYSLAQSIRQAALAAGFADCGVIPLDDMEAYAARLQSRIEAVPESGAFYEGLRSSANLRERFPWAKSLVVCTHRYGRYRYPEALQGRYAKGFFLSLESDPSEAARRQRRALPQWFDAQRIRWSAGPIFGLRHAALAAGLGVVRRNNFFYDGEGSWLELTGYVIDRTCHLRRELPLRPCPPGCKLCEKRCPTGSLSAPYSMNPRRCISYCTTFGGGAVPEEVDARAFGEWMLGCDRCQDVCPFNRHDWSAGEDFPGLEALLPLLKPEAILAATDEELAERVIPRTANHLRPDEVETLRKNAARLVQNQENA